MATSGEPGGMSTRLTGTVTTYDPRKCYGYIQSPRAAVRFFFHRDDLAEEVPPEPGAAVEFTPDPTAPRGPRASDVRRVDLAAPKEP